MLAAAKGLPRCETSLCPASKQPGSGRVNGRKLTGSPQGSSFAPSPCRRPAGSCSPAPAAACQRGLSPIALPCSALAASPSQSFPGKAQGTTLPEAGHPPGHPKAAIWKLRTLAGCARCVSPLLACHGARPRVLSAPLAAQHDSGSKGNRRQGTRACRRRGRAGGARDIASGAAEGNNYVQFEAQSCGSSEQRCWNRLACHFVSR